MNFSQPIDFKNKLLAQNFSVFPTLKSSSVCRCVWELSALGDSGVCVSRLLCPLISENGQLPSPLSVQLNIISANKEALKPLQGDKMRKRGDTWVAFRGYKKLFFCTSCMYTIKYISPRTNYFFLSLPLCKKYILLYLQRRVCNSYSPLEENNKSCLATHGAGLIMFLRLPAKRTNFIRRENCRGCASIIWQVIDSTTKNLVPCRWIWPLGLTEKQQHQVASFYHRSVFSKVHVCARESHTVNTK